MTYPLKAPYAKVTTPYGKRGSYWSCNEDSHGNGVHTGCDLAAPAGTNIYAPIAGQVRHRSYGSSFGNHQFAISPDPGQPFAAGEVFFAHTTNRPPDGAHVQIGDYIADVGSEGNTSGPHLHMEFHKDTKGSWSCSVHDDPQPILDHQGDDMGNAYDYGLHGAESVLKVTSSYVKLVGGTEWNPSRDGLQMGKLYFKASSIVFKDGKHAGGLKYKCVRENPTDPTWYNIVPLHVDWLDGGEFNHSFASFESGEHERNLHWEVKCIGGLSSCSLATTRYAGWAVIAD